MKRKENRDQKSNKNKISKNMQLTAEEDLFLSYVNHSVSNTKTVNTHNDAETSSKNMQSTQTSEESRNNEYEAPCKKGQKKP